MRKFYIIITAAISLIIFAVALCFIFTSTILGSILTSSFGANTTVANTIITTDSVKLFGLNVNNPPGTKHPHALSIRRIAIYAPLTNYFREDIVINQIILDKLVLDVEVLPNKNNYTNWDEIISHISNTQTTDQASDRDSTVKLLRINNLVVKYTDLEKKTHVTRMKNLTFRNLSTKNGDITSQIARTIVLRMIFNAQNVIKFPLKFTNQTLQQFFKNTPVQIEIKKH